jgi:hypothetical protein
MAKTLVRQWPAQLINILKGSSRCLGGVLAFLLLVTIQWLGLGGISPAYAGLNDDHYDGNIFALYAGNGSIVPPESR